MFYLEQLVFSFPGGSSQSEGTRGLKEKDFTESMAVHSLFLFISLSLITSHSSVVLLDQNRTMVWDLSARHVLAKDSSRITDPGL